MSLFGIMIDDKNGKDLLEQLGMLKEDTKNGKAEGCQHLFNRNVDLFCSKCGAMAWWEDDEDSPVWDIIDDNYATIEKITKLDCVYEEDIGRVLGVWLDNDKCNYKQIMKKIEKAIPILKKYFPKETPEFW